LRRQLDLSGGDHGPVSGGDCGVSGGEHGVSGGDRGVRGGEHGVSRGDCRMSGGEHGVSTKFSTTRLVGDAHTHTPTAAHAPTTALHGATVVHAEQRVRHAEQDRRRGHHHPTPGRRRHHRRAEPHAGVGGERGLRVARVAGGGLEVAESGLGDGARGARVAGLGDATVDLGLYPIDTFQYGSTTLYQVFLK
jgi:hypothetical protein